MISTFVVYGFIFADYLLKTLMLNKRLLTNPSKSDSEHATIQLTEATLHRYSYEKVF